MFRAKRYIYIFMLITTKDIPVVDVMTLVMGVTPMTASDGKSILSWILLWKRKKHAPTVVKCNS